MKRHTRRIIQRMIPAKKAAIGLRRRARAGALRRRAALAAGFFFAAVFFAAFPGERRWATNGGLPLPRISTSMPFCALARENTALRQECGASNLSQFRFPFMPKN
ncbi:MAG: hypothetical protein ACP5DX_08130 [Paracoccaceae bacterium]